MYFRGMRKLKRELRNKILTLLLRIKKFKSEDSILIFSEARGGSTWLLEMLSNIPDTCINWEPLHVQEGVVPEKYGFGYKPSIQADFSENDYIKLFDEIHTFSRSTEWTRKYLTFRSLLISKNVITKYVRANRLLPFILKKFHFKYPPILLIRHPIDTCLSQVKAFRQDYLNEQIHDLLKRQRGHSSQRDTSRLCELNKVLAEKVERWCINNVDTIKQVGSKDNITVVHYSELLKDPETELERILERYDIKNK